MMRLVLLLSCITLYGKCEDKAIFYAERSRSRGDHGLILERKVSEEGNIQVQQTQRKTIVNGWDTKKGLYPWYASIHRSASSQGYDKHYFYCGGSLVNEEFVLTGKQPLPLKSSNIIFCVLTTSFSVHASRTL